MRARRDRAPGGLAGGNRSGGTRVLAGQVAGAAVRALRPADGVRHRPGAPRPTCGVGVRARSPRLDRGCDRGSRSPDRALCPGVRRCGAGPVRARAARAGTRQPQSGRGRHQWRRSGSRAALLAPGGTSRPLRDAGPRALPLLLVDPPPGGGEAACTACADGTRRARRSAAFSGDACHAVRNG